MMSLALSAPASVMPHPSAAAEGLHVFRRADGDDVLRRPRRADRGGAEPALPAENTITICWVPAVPDWASRTRPS